MNNIQPIAVLISDVHYNIHTLDVADAVMKQAILQATSLFVPLVVCGDLHDTKANLRVECVLRIQEMLDAPPNIYLLTGNHDLVNEKSNISALDIFANLSINVSREIFAHNNFTLIPYHSNISELKMKLIMDVDPNKPVIMHQGMQGALSGHYIKDKTALQLEDVAHLRCISGHYHARQDIKCGQIKENNRGLFSYVGNPYTLNFGEANDPKKGFQILMSDGSLQFVPTNQRKHMIININEQNEVFPEFKDNDILWVKATFPSDKLTKINKKDLAKKYKIKQDFRLELIPTETKTRKTPSITNKPTMFDNIIDSTTETDERKIRLKDLWKNSILETT